MTSEKPPAKVLPFERPRRFPEELNRLQAALDEENAVFTDDAIKDGLACANAAIRRGVRGGLEAKGDLTKLLTKRLALYGKHDEALARWGEFIEEHPTYVPAYLHRAELFAKQKDLASALAVLDRCVEAAPTDALGYFERAKILKEQGDNDRALANLHRATQLDPTLYNAHMDIGILLNSKGDKQGAKRAFSRVAEEELATAEDYNFRGFLFFLQEQDDLALADYERSLAMVPNDPETISWRGLCRLRINRLEGALSDFTRFIAMKPQDMRGYFRRGEALVRLGRPAEGLKDLNHALELDKDTKAPVYYPRGMAHQALGDLQAALKDFEKAVEHDPSHLPSRFRKFQVLAEIGELSACRSELDAMLTREPNNPALVHTSARFCAEIGQRDEALIAYNRLLELDPKNSVAYFERSRLHVGLGNSGPAVADMAKAFELAPDNLEVRGFHGRYLAMNSQTPELRESGYALIQSAAERDADNPEAWAQAADHIRSCGNPMRALPFIERALELAPNNVEHICLRVTCLHCGAPAESEDPTRRKSMLETALAEMDRAISLAPEEDIELYRSRAELREDLGDLHGALADQTKMIEMDPEFIDAWEDRARLRKHTGDLAGARADAVRIAEIENRIAVEWAKIPALKDARVERFDLDAV